VTDAWQAVQRLLDEACAAGITAGASLSVVVPGRASRSLWSGCAEHRPLRRPAAEDTWYDLASLTKVLCTTSLAMAFVADGRLDLERPVRRWIPAAPAGVSAAHLLQHSSGLPAWLPLFDDVIGRGLAWGGRDARAAVLDRICRAPLHAAPGQQHCYSDLGFLLLGAALEVVGGAPLDVLFATHVRGPSGVDLRWGAAGAAATEDCPVRGGVVVGTVHDLNAAVLGGVASHAGLFGTARAVASVGAWVLAGGPGGGGDTGLDVLRRFSGRDGPGSHALGWDRPTPGACSAGPRWPSDGLGHTGFTGTSLWLAPRAGVAVALLCNRVHPRVDGGSWPGAVVSARTRQFRALRPAVHEAVIDALSAEGSWPGVPSR
jgi:serine-type D-Ala-D-Ala carboxypeptidase